MDEWLAGLEHTDQQAWAYLSQNVHLEWDSF